MKKFLAIILAILTLSSTFAMGVYATDETEGTPDTTVTEEASEPVVIEITTDTAKKTASVKLTVAEGYAVKGAVINGDADCDALADGTYKCSGLTLGKEYTVTVTATAADSTEKTFTKTFKLEKAAQAPLTEADLTIDVTATSIKVSGPIGAEYSINGTDYRTPDSRTYSFEDLTTGQEYTLSARMKETESAYASTILTIKITPRDKQAAPSKITVENITATEITVSKLTGAEYCVKGGAWQDSNTISNLTPETAYTVMARYKATEAKAASDAATVEVKTKKTASEDAAVAIQIQKITQTSIVLNNIDGYEYSLDDGKTWQNSNTFSGLTAGKTYVARQRRKAADDQEASKPSEARNITTNTAEVYAPSINLVAAPKFKEATVYTANDNTVIATGLARTTGLNQWGDLKYVPSYCTITLNGEEKKAGDFVYNATDKNYTANVVPPQDGSYILTVYYVVKRYEGASATEVPCGNETKTINFNSVNKPSAFVSFIQNLAKLMFTTIPQLIIKALDLFRGIATKK